MPKWIEFRSHEKKIKFIDCNLKLKLLGPILHQILRTLLNDGFAKFIITDIVVVSPSLLYKLNITFILVGPPIIYSIAAIN